MFRELVRGNKLCYKFNEQKKQEIHTKKLQTAECIVNNMNPQAYNLAIPFSNKRNQILEEKYTEIERENRILLEKITNIMHNKQDKPRSLSINPNVHRKTLHSGIRMKELVKITVENQQILNRIRVQKPTYDTRQILKQTSRQSEMVQRISEYSQINPIPNPKRALNRTTLGRYMNKGSGDIKLDNQSFNEYDPQQYHKHSDKLVLYKASQIHGPQTFIVEIFIQDDLFKITADDQKYPTTKILEMSQSDGRKVLQTIFENNINLFAQALVINERIHVQGLEQFEQIEETMQQQIQ